MSILVRADVEHRLVGEYSGSANQTRSSVAAHRTAV